MNIRVRELPGIRAVTLSQPAEADIELINAEFARQRVSAEDIHVREARIAHNFHDRTLERFQKAHLERFAETLPGKSLLPGHDTRQLPLGRWFRADTRARVEEFPVLQREQKEAGAARGKQAEIVPGFEPQRLRVTWLDGAFYFAADPSTEAFRKNIDMGVYQDVSIGFSYDDLDCDVCKKSYFSDCPHYRGQVLEDGLLVTLTYAGDPKLYEARETSIVYLGAQQHAELTKQLREGRIDPKALAQTGLGEDLAALKEYEALARRHGHQQKSWAFPALAQTLDSSPPEGEEPPQERAAALPAPSVDGDDPPAAVAAPDQGATMALTDKARKALGLAETAAEAEIEAALEGIDLKALQDDAARVPALAPLADIGKTALDDQAKAYVDHCLRLGQNETEAQAVAELFTGRGDYAGLKKLADAKFAEVCERFPAAPAGQVETPPAAPVRRERPQEFALV